ncbi:MAG: class I SAM-dependent methyltransferase [Acidobacteriota bacterium]
MGVLQRVAASLVSHPRIYDLVQNLAGQAKVAARLRTRLEALPHRRVLDVGSSEGGFAARLGVGPVCLDLDPRALAALRRRELVTKAVAADASALPFPGGTFDLTVCVAVFHHVDDATLSRVVSELSRITSGHLLFLDPLKNDARGISRWLWKYDRGRHPRDRETLLRALGEHFRVVVAEEFAVYHQYLLCVAIPRRNEPAP